MSYVSRIRVRTLVAFVCLSVAAPATVLAQGRLSLKSVDQRLKRVETVLDQSLLDLVQQVESLKREIRQLRGELESQAHELEKSRKQNRDLYLDTDQRLSTIENQLNGGAAGGAPAGDDGGGLEINITPGDDNTTGSLSPVQAPSDDEQLAYNNAYRELSGRDYPAAAVAFGEFLKKYPDGSYADNAWYWQGEALYAQRKFDQAIENFSTLVESFPQSPKVPDARLKIGFAFFEQRQYKNARNALSAVQQDYPGRSAAVLARKRLQDMNARGL